MWPNHQLPLKTLSAVYGRMVPGTLPFPSPRHRTQSLEHPWSSKQNMFVDVNWLQWRDHRVTCHGCPCWVSVSGSSQTTLPSSEPQFPYQKIGSKKLALVITACHGGGRPGLDHFYFYCSFSQKRIIWKWKAEGKKNDPQTHYPNRGTKMLFLPSLFFSQFF